MAFAQTKPWLDLQFSAAQARLIFTGDVGTVYSIQFANGLSPTNPWKIRTLLQTQAGTNIWSDPSTPATGLGLYRAVSVAAPANPNLVFIRPGTFTMGSPNNEAERTADETQHTVTITHGFWIAKYLVTQADYLSLMATNPSYFNAVLTRPVEQVSWYDASNYCALLTAKELASGRIPTNFAYRLPTEAEWEYACRAGTTTAFYLGPSLTSGMANFDGFREYDASVGTTYNPNGFQLHRTIAVGSYTPNPWGLYDMAGNVWEWCQDWYGPYDNGNVTDPQGPSTGTHRVFRGGDWSNYGVSCRSAARGYGTPTKSFNFVGFRVVLALVQ
jgi:formylglycine-generating enzyme required for sulfatase activity